MHRHGYRGKKLSRERDQRRALLRGLATALVEYESIETTYRKAKAVLPYTEKLITKAKVGTLHSRRQVISGLETEDAAHKLVDDIAPLLTARNSGHLRLEKTRLRRGDGAQMAQVSFVDDLSTSVTPAKTESKDTDKKTEKKSETTKKKSDESNKDKDVKDE